MTKIIFGNNKRFCLKKIIKNSSKILIVCSNRTKKIFLRQNKFNIQNSCKIFWINNIENNPSLIFTNNLINSLPQEKFDYILAIGGGSVIDASKIIKLNILSFKKLKKKGVKIKKLPTKRNLKLICLPTTSGTGSEVTQFSTVWDMRKKIKISLEDDLMRPDYSITDPVLSYTMPKIVTYSTALDALNQCFDSYWNINANSITKKLAKKTIFKIISGLKKIIINSKDKSARKILSYSSLQSGICISKTRTSICHSFSYPLTMNYNIDHGYACAFTMLSVIKYVNLKNKNFFDHILRKNKKKKNSI